MQVAYDFSNKTSSELLIIHQIIGKVPGLSDAQSEQVILENQSKRALNRLKELAANASIKNAKFIVSEKSITSILNEIKSNNNSDLVIMGLKGTSFIKKLVLGSKVSKVIDNTDLISIAIPINQIEINFNKLIVALSIDSPINSSIFIKLLMNIDESHKIETIEFVSVVNDTSIKEEITDYIKSISSQIKTIPTTIKLLTEEESPSKTLINYMKSNENAFLVLQQGERDTSDFLFRKFTTNELVYDGNIPLIIISK